eukprot:COSAG01_NODE_702_length_14141_cov_36.742739_8_plen_261_part_00
MQQVSERRAELDKARAELRAAVDGEGRASSEHQLCWELREERNERVRLQRELAAWRGADERRTRYAREPYGLAPRTTTIWRSGLDWASPVDDASVLATKFETDRLWRLRELELEKARYDELRSYVDEVVLPAPTSAASAADTPATQPPQPLPLPLPPPTGQPKTLSSAAAALPEPPPPPLPSQRQAARARQGQGARHQHRAARSQPRFAHGGGGGGGGGGQRSRVETALAESRRRAEEVLAGDRQRRSSTPSLSALVGSS